MSTGGLHAVKLPPFDSLPNTDNTNLLTFSSGTRVFFSFFFSLIFITWKLITLQYCSGFCHTLTWNCHEFTCVSHPERIVLKQVYYQVWNRSPAQVGCMRQVLRTGALGRPRGMGWGGRWEGGSGWGSGRVFNELWRDYDRSLSLDEIKYKMWFLLF